MAEAPPNLPGTLSRPDAQIIIDALNKRVWEGEEKAKSLEAKAAALEEKPVIVGGVSAAGAVTFGAGFTVEHTVTGKYKVVLTNELATTGIMDIQFNVAGATGFSVAVPAKKTFEIETYSSGASLANLSFSFFLKAT